MAPLHDGESMAPLHGSVPKDAQKIQHWLANTPMWVHWCPSLLLGAFCLGAIVHGHLDRSFSQARAETQAALLANMELPRRIKIEKQCLKESEEMRQHLGASGVRVASRHDGHSRAYRFLLSELLAERPTVICQTGLQHGLSTHAFLCGLNSTAVATFDGYMMSPGAVGGSRLEVARWFGEFESYRGRLVMVNGKSEAPPGCDMAYVLGGEHDSTTLDTTFKYFQTMASPNARVIVDGCSGAVRQSYDNAISMGLIEHERHVRIDDGRGDSTCVGTFLHRDEDSDSTPDNLAGEMTSRIDRSGLATMEALANAHPLIPQDANANSHSASVLQHEISGLGDTAPSVHHGVDGKTRGHAITEKKHEKDESAIAERMRESPKMRREVRKDRARPSAATV